MVKKTPVIDSEVGYTGLHVTANRIYEESRRELQFPYNIQTYDKMCQNITVASAMNAIVMLASRAEFYVEPYDQTDRHKSRAKLFEECMDDMEHSWYDFMREAMSFTRYGFSLHEKVYRYRRHDKGSKYDDGRVGIRKLPIRSQASIYKWKFSDSDRKLDKVVQRVSVTDGVVKTSFEKDIDMSRLLHFKSNPYKSNPEGVSPLNAVYQSWKMLLSLLDTELIATSKNLNGIPTISLPAKFMADDATDAEKAVYAAIKRIALNVNNGEQAAVLMPSDVDEQGNKMFSFDVVDSSTANISAVQPIIQRYTNEILQCLFADILQMGTEKGGNYNVVESKASLLEIAVEYYLTEVCNVINNNLIPELWRLNEWDATRTPKLCFNNLSKPDLAVWAKAMQQLAATNNILRTAGNINYAQEMMGLPDRLADDAGEDAIRTALGVDWKMQSRSSDGLSKGSSNGTSDEVSEDDNSANNLDNQ